ncbi:hypothetical protein Lalb_Chr19g0135491 [Lupinus albus]|uniref:Secreted peptide n=1 Tax=Lupinus albus TaxID=3870 RepID=A0A6A4NYQ5_LUPAL|nr:hypothetical protein Lalb_Chr19g0135491 [Lupinus albus]
MTHCGCLFFIFLFHNILYPLPPLAQTHCNSSLINVSQFVRFSCIIYVILVVAAFCSARFLVTVQNIHS